MREQFVGFRVSPQQRRKLDGLAALLGMSKSGVLQTLIDTARIESESITIHKPVGTLSTNDDGARSEAHAAA